METIIVTTEEKLEAILTTIIEKRLLVSTTEHVEKTYSINQVARLLGRSHKKISDLVANGILATTPDNRIYESSIREYNKR
jgi:hypothetical protein